MKIDKMTTDADIMFEMAKAMNDASRSSSDYGKILLLSDIIIGLEGLSLGVSSKANIKTYLEEKKAKIKEDIKRNSKYPDPFLDKL
tara:strand:+ start:264 stop:521 length:258 start_codon:yes stop_codon:yes gene_type:complete